MLISWPRAWEGEAPAEPPLRPGSAGASPSRGLSPEEPKDPDQQFLEESKVPTDGPGMLNFLRERSAHDDDLLHIDRLIRQLGAEDFRRRDEASRRLIAIGPPAHARLLEAQKDKDKERARRARECAEAINRAWKPGINLTAVRLLVKLHPTGVEKMLLQFLPYAADEECEEEIWFGLDTLAKNQPQPALRRQPPLPPGGGEPQASLPPGGGGLGWGGIAQFLKDKFPIRRAAAGYLLARRGDAARRAEAKKLLADSDPLVRLRTAQGLLGAKDKQAIPVLIDLLEKLKWTEEAWQAEEMLHWVAGDDAPEPTIGAGSAEARRKCRKAWQDWWQANAGKLDLAKLDQDYRRPGLILLLTSNNDHKNPIHDVSLMGCDGRPRWQLELPISHVQLLPRDRILVTEWENRQVLIAGRLIENLFPSGLSERDLTGKVLWQAPGNYAANIAYRLPNGNTLFPVQFSLAEITPEGQEVASPLKTALNDGLMFLAYPRRLANGNLLASTHPSGIIKALGEFDPAGGRLIRKIELLDKIEQGNIQPLPNGHYLVSSWYSARVIEVDGSGKTVWSTNLRVVGKPALLHNGNLLVLCPSGLVELDQQGKWKCHVFLEPQSSRFDSCLELMRLGFDWPLPQELDLATSIPYWSKSLRAKNTQMRITSGLRLRELGPKAAPAVPALISALDDPEVQVWRLAQDSLGNIGAPAVPSLVRALKSPKATIRSRAAWILGGFPADAETIIPVLFQAIKDPDVEVRQSAATALGSMNDDGKTIIPILISTLKNENEDDGVRLRAAHSLGRFGREAKMAVPSLLQCLTGKSAEVGNWAGIALGMIGPVDETVVPGLIEALKNERAVFAAAGALGQIGEEARAAVPALIEVVKTCNVKSRSGVTARECAIGALGSIGPPAFPAVPILLDILKNKEINPNLRVTAAIALSNIRPVSDETLSAFGDAAKESGHLGQVARQMLEKTKSKK